MRTKKTKQIFNSNFNGYMESIDSNEMYNSILKKLVINDDIYQEKKSSPLINLKYLFAYYSIILILIALSGVTVFNVFTKDTKPPMQEIYTKSYEYEIPTEFLDYQITEVTSNTGDVLSIYFGYIRENDKLRVLYTYTFERSEESQVTSVYFYNENTGESKDINNLNGFISDYININNMDSIQVYFEYSSGNPQNSETFVADAIAYLDIID